MPIDDPNELDDVDQAIRINELKAEAEELSGGTMASYESDDLPPHMAEALWQRFVDVEKTPWTSQFQLLTDTGVELPEPETLTDEEVTTKLWEVIHRMAAIRAFLSSTDHLSDRELYTELWSDSLREAMPNMPFDENSAYHIDMVGSGSDADNDIYLKHYLDEEGRAEWLHRYPDDEMPPHETPPYDRDRHLPKARR